MGATGRGKGTSTSKTRSSRKAKQPPALSGDDLRRLRGILESQRSLGGTSYPVAVKRLFEHAKMAMSDDALKIFAARKNAALFTLTAKASKTDPGATRNALVYVPEDEKSVAAARATLDDAFEAAKRGGSDIVTPAELVKCAPRSLQKAFRASVDGWARTGKAPFPGVIVLRHKAGRKATLYLHRLESPAPATAVRQPRPISRDFTREFLREFERLDRASGNNNYVLLHDLRRALPDIERAEFDSRLKDLRLAKLFTLDSPDGRHVSLTAEQLDAGIREGSSNLVYVARR
jgi:hypothetical protein